MGLALFAVLCLLARASAATDFSPWRDSVRVYFNTTAAGAPLAGAVRDFPLLIRIGKGDAALKLAAPGGADIRFTDSDGVELPCHIARWDTGFYQGAEVWVNVPKVSAGSMTDYVVMWYGNRDAPALPGSVKVRQGGGDVYLGGDVPARGKTVFDTAFGFLGAWHLDEDAALRGTAKLYRDASPAANHGDDSVSAPAGLGVVGRAAQFSPATGDLIAVKGGPAQRLDGPMTFSAWINGTQWSGVGPAGNSSQVNPIVRKGEDNPNPYQFLVAGGKLSLSLDSTDAGGVQGSKALDLNRWIYVAGVWDGSKVKLYVDGNLDVDRAPAKPPAPGKADGRALYLGGRPGNPANPGSMDYFSGALDEIHVSRAARGKDWIRLAYENQRPDSKLLRFEAVAAPAEDYSKWSHSAKLFFNTTASGAGLKQAVAGFPVLVRFTGDRFDFSQAEANGIDLRFADPDGTPLAYSMAYWDAARASAEVWVRVPRIDPDSKADYITMYWGNPLAPATRNGAAAFDTADGWSGVWHLQTGAPGKGAAGAYKDATYNANHGDDYASAGTEAAAIGNGQRFGPAARDYIRVASSPSLQPAAVLTASAWVKARSFLPEGSGHTDIVFRKGDASSGSYFQFGFRAGQPGIVLDNNGESTARYAGVPVDTGTWRLAGVTWGKDGTFRFYVDGQLLGSAAGNRANPAIAKDEKPFCIGGTDAAGADSADQFYGLLDEVEFSRVERSADWMKLAYESQRRDSRFLEWPGLPGTDTAGVGGAIDTVLGPGQALVARGTYQFANPANGDGPVRLQVQPARDRAGLGIKDAGETILLSPPKPDAPMPRVSLEVNAALPAGMSLFRVLPGAVGQGLVQSYGGGIGSWVLPQAGEYFLGIDTVPPRIRLVDEGSGDSDWVRVQAFDNVANLTLNVEHARGAADTAGATPRPMEAGGIARLAFPGPDDLSPELLSLSLSDGTASAGFPADGGAYQMQRRVRDAKAPVPLTGNLAWTFAGVPLRLEGRVSLKDASGGRGGLYGARWINDPASPRQGSWRLLEGDDSLPTGTGVWLAGASPLAALRLGDARSVSPGADGSYSIALTRGWNQVTCPGLEALPWPLRLADEAARDRSPFKTLLALEPSTGRYVDADTLRPWHGYFVYASEDVVVRLSRGTPADRPAPLGAAGSPSLQAVFEPAPGAFAAGAASRLRLGAAAYAADGSGIEDEPAAPAAGSSGGGLAIRRGGRGWRTDLVHWRGAGEYAWPLAWGGPAAGRPPVARLRVAGLRLPEGMALWAVAPLRKLAQPLREGASLEVLGDAADTVWLWAAPAGRFPRADGPLSGLPAARAAAWMGGPEGRLRLSLPEAAGVRVQCRDAAGRLRAGYARSALAAGYYEIPLGPMGVGFRIVTVDFRGGAGPRRFSLAIAGP